MADEQSIHADPLYLSALASLGANIPATLKMAPEGSSVAVLPFVDLSGEAGHEHFVDGLTEDIITDLSNVTGFFVIARNSTLAYKGKPTDVRQIAHDLGVKYVLEGSVRRSGQRLRVNVQLIDARGGGNHVWAERFDRDLADIFEVQDEVTKHIVSSISGKLSGNSVPERYRPSSLEAYELCVKSRDLFAQSSTATREAISQLQRAVALDPNYAEAYWRLAVAEMVSWRYWGEVQLEQRLRAVENVQRALQLDANDSRVHMAAGYVLHHERRFDEALAHWENSFRLNPNDPDAHMMFTDFKYMIHHVDQGFDHMATAFRLNPNPPGWYYWILGYMQVVKGRYSEAVATLTKKETYRSISRRNLAVALAMLGRMEEAREEARFFCEANPNWRISNWAANQAYQFPDDAKLWVDAFRLVGLPE